MASPVQADQYVFEGFDEFSEATNALLMTLMEEEAEDLRVDDDDGRFYGDHRLVSMIQSLEAEINIGSDHHPVCDQMGQVDGQGCSTSSSAIGDYYNDWVDNMEVMMTVSPSSEFDDDMNYAWNDCAAMMNIDIGSDFYNSEFSYGVLLDQQQVMQYFYNVNTN